jgi:uncharacterized membrane protein
MEGTAMKGRKGWIALAGCVSCVISTLTVAQETPTYRLTHVWTRVLDDPAHENDEFVINGINDKGQLAGYRIPGGAFVWRNGTFENLAPFESPVSWGVGINEWSDVAGYYVNPQLGTSSFFRRAGTLVPIADLPGESVVEAMHLNNRREVLLGAIADDTTSYYLWRRGQRTPLTKPPGLNAVPLRMNDAGVVVGSASSGGIRTPVMWQDGTVTLIALPEGASSGDARDINDAGTILIDTFTPVTGREGGNRWRDGQYTELGMLDGHSRVLTAAINNAGVVVGSASGEPSNMTTAAVWYDVQAHDLNSLVSANDPLEPFVRLSSALHINDRGEIVARGVDDRQGPGTISHYLLTPRY